jgi:hypothetical protein
MQKRTWVPAPVLDASTCESGFFAWEAARVTYATHIVSAGLNAIQKGT